MMRVTYRAACLFVMVIMSLNAAMAHAQADTISVSGEVRCGAEPVEYAVVAMLQPSDSAIVAYALTDAGGRYSLKAAPVTGEVLVKVTGFNIRRQVVRVTARSQTLDFNVEKESIELREVRVRARKLWGGRDTLNYLVSAYTRDHDRTIGDVLRQLPGITIADNGEIRYQGAPINHFYIENLDMLQGRYNIATEGIRAGDVATVQVLENHEHVRALQDQNMSDRAAINLKLKDKAKDVWTESADLGAGGYADGMLWEATLRAMCFGKSGQHIIRYSGDDMGRGDDVAAAHYGGTTEGGPAMTGIVGHGMPPVGNGLFGYRHGVSFDNLAKLSDSATVSYNFNYSHNLTRGNSFSQTTYILPDGSSLFLTEDIADRTHTNSADLQLTYEKNTARRFLNNTLSLFGKWSEGRGNLLSGGSDGSSPAAVAPVTQASHYRSLGVTDHARLVRRTAKGGGFEWNSTNSFSSTPQSLVIGGGMDARQDIDITALSTLNSLELLRNLRARHWTLSAMAHLNATYTALTSDLTHPETPTAPHGDLDHLRAEAGLGPLARYVNGAFQSTLRLPLSVAYTRLGNAPVDGEETDAHRLRLRLQPSFSLLWKASDNFTINAGANYTDSETPWTRLLTATVMHNYRSLSRYRAALNDSYGAGANVKVSYKDIFKGLFAYIEGSWSRAWSDIAYGTTLDAQAHTVVEAAHAPNHANHYSLTAYGRKDIDWHTTQLELSATATRGKSEMLRQSVLTTYRSTGYELRGTLAFDIVAGCRMDYGATWRRDRSTSTGYSDTFTEFSQRARLSMRLWPQRLSLSFNASHTHNGSLASSKKDYLFIGAGLRFKASKKVELDLDGDNLTDIRTFTVRSPGDMEEHHVEYRLRPLSVTLTAHVSL